MKLYNFNQKKDKIKLNFKTLSNPPHITWYHSTASDKAWFLSLLTRPSKRTAQDMKEQRVLKPYLDRFTFRMIDSTNVIHHWQQALSLTNPRSLSKQLSRPQYILWTDNYALTKMKGVRYDYDHSTKFIFWKNALHHLSKINLVNAVTWSLADYSFISA